jgi:hypothetical protein
VSDTLHRVRLLVGRGEYVVSQHGARELVGREIVLDDLVSSLDEAAVVEDYPDAWKGPCVLVLQRDREQRPVHAL